MVSQSGSICFVRRVLNFSTENGGSKTRVIWNLLLTSSWLRHLRLLLLINSHFSGVLTHYLLNFWKNQLKKFSVYKREITVSLFLDKFFSKSSIYTNGTTMNFKNSFSLQFSVVSLVGAQMGRTTSSKSCAKSSSENDGPTLSSMLIQNSP